MAYQPTVWLNREVERPRTFEMQSNPDGTITLIPSEGAVTEPGTPITAANMNRIEDQLVAMEHHAANHEIGGIDPINVDKSIYIDTVVYVNRSIGNDSNDGSINSPLKTITRALETTNKVQFGHREILLQDAGPFSIPPIVDFIGGKLTISKPTGLAVLDLENSGTFNAVQISNCLCDVTIKGFEVDSDLGEATFVISDVKGTVLLSGIAAILSSLSSYKAFARTENAKVEISACTITNHNTVLNGQKGSFVVCTGNSGTGNEMGYRSNMAIVIRDNSIAATVMELKHAGGQIFS